jgi:hypothetical protein
MYKEITKCRICGNTKLESVINLGEQSLTGVFPKSRDEKITSGPLELVKCMEDENNEFCGLVQLKQSYNRNEMYGESYGYRSGLNTSMVEHLRDVVNKNLQYVSLNPNDLIIDIGSNDGTLLKLYPTNNYLLGGLDPAALKFKKYYTDNIKIIPEFFTSEIVKNHFNDKKAKIVTSIAMFYDLENPIDFVKDVHEILDDEGIWVLEQSYMPLMLQMNAYDTICHEHLEYYGLKQIKWLFDKVGFKILDVELNNINGGSFKLIVSKTTSKKQECIKLVNEILENERNVQLYTLEPFKKFKKKIIKHRNELRLIIDKINRDNKKVFGYGASTKGNVILQYCGFTEKDIPYIAEVNEDKFGAFTPSTHIPIISEKEAKAMKPDYFLVLPWHFRDNIVIREKDFINSGTHLIFPLPRIEII